MNIAYFILPKEHVACIYEKNSLRQAIEKMKYHGYTAVPILNDEEEYINVLSEGDLLYEFSDGCTIYDLEKKYIKELTPKRTIKSVHILTSMEELIDCALNQNFVPVVDDRNKFIGIITRKAIIEYFYTHGNDTYAYNCGVMDTFAEMVKAGMKKMALAHPFKEKKERDAYIPFVEDLCSKYGLGYYLDDEPLITDLFEKHLNYETFNIIFYKEKETIDEYVYLKQYKKENIDHYDKVRGEIAYRFGKCLSYSDETIQNYIDSNNEKE